MMKIQQHPQMQGIVVGDEVYSYDQQLFARVVETFPAAVCVRLGILSIAWPLELVLAPQLWRADDIANLSICRRCGSRENLYSESDTGVPFRLCRNCSQDNHSAHQPLPARQNPAAERP